MTPDSHQSVFREQLIQHLLIGDLLKLSWKYYHATLEVSHPSIDRSGHDIVLEANGITRHVQLKTSSVDARTGSQKVQLGLMSKPSGCVVWIRFNPETLEIGPFQFFGGLPGQPLPSVIEFPVAKHTKGNATGVKLERPNIRVIPKSKFTVVPDVKALYAVLFGEPSNVSPNADDGGS